MSRQLTGEDGRVHDSESPDAMDLQLRIHHALLFVPAYPSRPYRMIQRLGARAYVLLEVRVRDARRVRVGRPKVVRPLARPARRVDPHRLKRVRARDAQREARAGEEDSEVVRVREVFGVDERFGERVRGREAHAAQRERSEQDGSLGTEDQRVQ